MSRLLDQIEQALTSSDTSDAVRLWLWLKLAVAGECTIPEMLDAELPNVVESANALHASQRIKFVGDRVLVLPFTKSTAKRRGRPGVLGGLEGRELYLVALENPRASGAATALREAEGWVFSAYNRSRKKHNVRELPAAQRVRNVDHWRAAAQFVLANNIDLGKLIEFAFERTRWQQTKFPAPSLIGGEWLQQEWRDKDSGKSRDHAGHSYATSDGLQPALVEAGFAVASTLDDKMIRHIFKMAKTLKKAPKLREPHSDKEIESMVQWAAKNYDEA